MTISASDLSLFQPIRELPDLGVIATQAVIADAELVASYVPYEDCWRWFVTDLNHGITMDLDVTEGDGYPTREEAEAACLNFYVREWHPEDQ